MPIYAGKVCDMRTLLKYAGKKCGNIYAKYAAVAYSSKTGIPIAVKA